MKSSNRDIGTNEWQSGIPINGTQSLCHRQSAEMEVHSDGSALDSAGLALDSVITEAAFKLPLRAMRPIS